MTTPLAESRRHDRLMQAIDENAALRRFAHDSFTRDECVELQIAGPRYRFVALGPRAKCQAQYPGLKPPPPPETLGEACGWVRVRDEEGSTWIPMRAGLTNGPMGDA